MNEEPTPLSFTRVPRWTAPAGGETGTGVHQALLSADESAALRQIAVDLEVPLGDLLLAVHTRVLLAVTGESEVLLCCRGRRPGQDREHLMLAASGSTWRELIATGATRADLPVDATAPEIVLDLRGLRPDLRTPLDVGPEPAGPEFAVLTAVWRIQGDHLALDLRYEREALDASYAERLAEYHVAAARALAADPAAQPGRPSLLSGAEVDLLLHGLAGPRAELPNRSFTDLFRQQARATPDSVAVQHGERSWTYAELLTRADRVAQALHAAGLQTEDVVAVVTDRTLDWIAAAIGVFQAGGVYFPVRPDFPAERVTRQFERSECAFVLVEPAGAELVRAVSAALPLAPAIVTLDELPTADGGTTVPEIVIAPEQAAYIYFTSGSTGMPKGAVCEHAGLLNHLLMKIEDLGMQPGPGEVVTQTASQCFDISLWQFAAPLMIGGTVRIVDTDVLLDVDRFLDTLVGGQVTVAQIVPSYLEILLTRLEQHPRRLDSLRILSVTGEALKFDLVQRWFALYPRIRLANAYGATEVSDDTMHEILDGVPERGFVSVGRSLRNVNTYVLNDQLELVPLGSVGEIAFSGVCVGRGYINDQERTREAFVPDPFRPGTRMYRTGDYGRWLPEGRMEYRGRRDEQVKIRGFRIEIGEIENRLLAMPGIRQAAVIIDGAAGARRALVAFVSGDQEVSPDEARAFLAAGLPEYMLPSYFHQLDRLPLTENGKINKKSLERLAGTLGQAGPSYVAPADAGEHRMAMLWSEVLGTPVERIGRADNFFDLGGTSLAAVRLLVRLDQNVSLRDLTTHAVLAELTALLERRLHGKTPGTAQPASLLQPLSRVTHPHHTLVCFPYAGGNAVNFRALAAELARDGIAVLGVEPPGHDFTDDDEALESVSVLSRRIRDEILEQVSTPVSLWGHCAGAATALETGRLLAAKGVNVHRMFLAASLFKDTPALTAESEQIATADVAGVLEGMRALSAYVELDAFKPERAEVAARAYRHDVLTANDYLAQIREEPQPHRTAVPVTVVIARDDESTDGFGERYADWSQIAAQVDLHVLDQGGHYFISTHPREAADPVRSACLPQPRN